MAQQNHFTNIIDNIVNYPNGIFDIEIGDSSRVRVVM